ncbi:MAG: hypothetical protein JJE07_12330 [Flavobacteriaceae bacterium]|nr:hypothetical protein [Flavobacteriaceae bacterium]
MRKFLWILFLIIFSTVNAQSSHDRFVDDFGWTPWKDVFYIFLDGLLYIIPGVIILTITALVFKKLDDSKKILQIIFSLFALIGVGLTIFGLFHLLPLLANLEFILWTTIYVGVAILIVVFLSIKLIQMAKKIRRPKKV